MKNNDIRRANILYHLIHLLDELEGLNENEINDLFLSDMFKNISVNTKTNIHHLLNHKNYSLVKKRSDDSFEQFKFDLIMERLRSVIMNNPNHTEAASEIDWLLRILLVSPQLFKSVREVDNFLANVTGLNHETKNTGRDRIVDWYLKSVRSLPKDTQDRIFHRIAKYIFVNMPSNYKEWKHILYGEGKK